MVKEVQTSVAGRGGRANRRTYPSAIERERSYILEQNPADKLSERIDRRGLGITIAKLTCPSSSRGLEEIENKSAHATWRQLGSTAEILTITAF